MIRFMVLIVAGIFKIFFFLRLGVIAVSHHQIPMHLFYNNIMCRIKSILALSYILYCRSLYSCLFMTLLRQFPYILLLPPLFILEEPIRHICSYNSYITEVSFPEILQHHRSLSALIIALSSCADNSGVFYTYIKYTKSTEGLQEQPFYTDLIHLTVQYSFFLRSTLSYYYYNRS